MVEDDSDNNNNRGFDSDDESGQNVIFNKRALLMNTKWQYKSIAVDLVQFLIRYRYENYKNR
jgi:hypothetical protein